MYYFKSFIDTKNFNDSMELESGNVICDFYDGRDSATIQVAGEVYVIFEDKEYHSVSEFPEELKQLFHSGKAYHDPRVVIENNNWIETNLTSGESIVEDNSTVLGVSPKQLLEYCKQLVSPEVTHEFALTDKGFDKITRFIRECSAKRKEILNAGKDTADETNLPDIPSIISDIEWDESVANSDSYINCWGVTDNYNSAPLSLDYEEDFIKAKKFEQHLELDNKSASKKELKTMQRKGHYHVR